MINAVVGKHTYGSDRFFLSGDQAEEAEGEQGAREPRKSQGEEVAFEPGADACVGVLHAGKEYREGRSLSKSTKSEKH